MQTALHVKDGVLQAGNSDEDDVQDEPVGDNVLRMNGPQVPTKLTLLLSHCERSQTTLEFWKALLTDKIVR
jgi:hypothetical protein